MHFAHRGRQFFFVTLALEDRKPILSRLAAEQSRPELSAFGETVKSALLAVHGAFPCATISDFVIMPDHVHFLLIADYSRNPGFSPLWAAHRLMDATEMIWGKDGGSAPAPPEALARAIAVARRNQGRLTVDGAPPILQRHPAIAQAEAQPSSILPPIGGSGARPPSVPRWNRHCYIELSFDARQLKAIRRYIRLNSARALWKRRHPDRFIRFANIRHAVLDPARRWDAMGTPLLLSSPFLTHVRLTMKKTAEEHAAEIDSIMERAVRGLVPVSGFISPGEKELLRRLKAEPQARFIKTVPFSLPPRYDPSAEDSRELAADRLLILSGFPQGTPDSRENLRARCNIMNSLAAALCSKAAEMA